MNRNNNFLQFNPNSYKKHLSPFGQNVLDTLVKNWRTGFGNKENRNHQQFTTNQNRRNVGGHYSDSRAIPSIPSSPVCGGAQNAQEQNFCIVPLAMTKQMLHDGNPEPSNTLIPASSALVKTIYIPNTNDEEILTANDMVTPVINFDQLNENLFSKRKHIDETDVPPLQFLQILNGEDKEKHNRTRDEVITIRENRFKKDVQWDDMFDTELFPDLNAPLQLIAPLEEENGNNFEMEFPKDKNRNQSVSNNKVLKHKAPSKVCEALTKKVKKIKVDQNVTDTDNVTNKNFKKMKYTKQVKNWLDAVDPNIFVEDKVDQHNTVNEAFLPKVTPIHETNNEKLEFDSKKEVLIRNKESLIGIEKILQQESETSGNESRSHVEEVVDQGAKEIDQPKTTEFNKTITVKVSSKTEIQKNTKGKSKKVVQARLAQKDGKMKFGPPTKEKADTTTDTETRNKELVKEKKAKVKFVAPTKSQVPVKHVTFDVKTIDDSNLYLIDVLINAENNDIVIVLTYSNGYCQLNNHHKEDTCVPDGVMIQLHDQFFYFKENLHNTNFIRQLIEGYPVICYNGKELLIHLNCRGIELKQDAFNFNDAKIGGSLIDPDSPPESFVELQRLLGFTPEFTIATECVLQKTAWYTTLLRECFDKLKSLLTENFVWNIFIEIEMRLLPVIAGMEHRGVCVDLEKLKSMEEILLTKMKAVEQECYKAAGKTFQINSALQVRTILYDELQLDTKSSLKIKETIGKGAKSTSETMLRGLVSVHPLPRLILEYRHLHKAHATFLSGIGQHVNDGLVKPTWVQTAAATGRIASNNPNLQAIPKAPFSLVMFPETSDDQEPLNFRRVYTARSGHWLVAADFKHVECRVFAHAAADAALLAALRQQGDLFRVLAAKWLNKPVDDVSSEDRERTKRIVYASLYGAGARKLMEILQVSYEQALSIMSSFHRTFPALKRFGAAAVERARSGLLRTLCGRARRFRHIASADAALRAHAERQAVNFVVQGSAADLCKTAMVVVQRQLEQQSVQGRLLLQIHDELVWEVADDHVVRAAAIIKEAMENVGRQCGMDLSLPVELTRGRNWGEMRPFPECVESRAGPSVQAN